MIIHSGLFICVKTKNLLMAITLGQAVAWPPAAAVLVMAWPEAAAAVWFAWPESAAAVMLAWLEVAAAVRLVWPEVVWIKHSSPVGVG